MGKLGRTTPYYHNQAPALSVLSSGSIAYDDFTDGTGTSGYYDFTSTLPIGAIPLAWKAKIVTAFGSGVTPVTGTTLAFVDGGGAGDTITDSANGFGDFFRDTWSYNYNTFDDRHNVIIPIDSVKYLPNDNAATNPTNRGKESTVSIKISDDFDMTDYPSHHYKDTIIITLNKLILNAYSDYTIRKVVATNSLLRIHSLRHFARKRVQNLI